MGRPAQTQLNYDPSKTIYVDTTYDNLGRVASVSNPYQNTSELTYGITSYSYDALGRKILQCQPDNGTPSNACTAGSSYLQWGYTGNIVTFTDENRHSWQRASDGLGRLQKVVEPNGAATYYTYDARDNLTCAAQDGGSGGAFTSCSAAPASWRPRTFAYDSLSRLITARNPETGTVCYGTLSGGTCNSGYDANGNLGSKTDARGVTTSYSYDALNRWLSKTYSNAPAGTVSSCYQYDTAANGVGRLASEWTKTGGCTSAATYQSLRVVGGYDSMGRVVSEQQCVAGYCTSNTAPSAPAPNCTSLGSSVGLQYCYDLAGDLLAYSNGVTTQAAGTTYPQHALLFSQTFDAAGRRLSVDSSWSDATHPGTLDTDLRSHECTLQLAARYKPLDHQTVRQKDARVQSAVSAVAEHGSTVPVGIPRWMLTANGTTASGKRDDQR
jgi:YD repeat-containing protein